MTNDNALMGGPLSEAERLTERYSVDEVREYLSVPPVVDGHRHHKDIDRLAFLLNLVGVLEGQLATAQAKSVQLNSQLKDPGLDWLIDWAMGTDRDARDHYFHINDGDADSCDCKHEGEGSDV